MIRFQVIPKHSSHKDIPDEVEGDNYALDDGDKLTIWNEGQVVYRTHDPHLLHGDTGGRWP